MESKGVVFVKYFGLEWICTVEISLVLDRNGMDGSTQNTKNLIFANAPLRQSPILLFVIHAFSAIMSPFFKIVENSFYVTDRKANWKSCQRRTQWLPIWKRLRRWMWVPMTDCVPLRLWTSLSNCGISTLTSCHSARQALSLGINVEFGM